jgi:hypothetical protein
MDKLKDITANKAILSFKDVAGVSQEQLRINQREERSRDRRKKKEAGKNGSWEAL